MKKVFLCVLALSLCLSGGAWASAICEGSACCDSSASRDYLYTVTESTAFGTFLVGTCDGILANYTNILMPTGWTMGIYSAEAPNAPYVPKGSITASTGSDPWIVLWYCEDAENAVTSATFGFNNPNAPETASWAVATASMSTIEGGDWTSAVGLGSGPVHAPGSVPEPLSLLTLATGLIGFTGLKIRARH